MGVNRDKKCDSEVWRDVVEKIKKEGKDTAKVA